ncbi:MAG: hypothetical protein WCT04_01465 [Planctomycetota bacterium]
MRKDPILAELDSIRSDMADEFGGLKGLHKRSLQLQDELRKKNAVIVNFHNACDAKNTHQIEHPRLKRKAAG